MSISFKTLLTDCLVALGDSTGTTWARISKMWPWCIEAIRTFPILRPMYENHLNAGGLTYTIALPLDFREMISVEYPAAQTPPEYLVRKNRRDTNFYSQNGYYDVDHDYAAGTGWFLYVSNGITHLTNVFIQYLANHDTDMADDDAHLLTIPDEYENILIANVICRAYRERLSYFMQNPTAHSNVIMQYTTMVQKAEDSYHAMVAAAQLKLVESKITTNKTLDKFDRVY
jgi:hypothetical protein